MICGRECYPKLLIRVMGSLTLGMFYRVTRPTNAHCVFIVCSSTSFGGAITSIPPSIADLEKLVVLAGPTQVSRLSPAPASVTSSPTKPARTKRVFTRAKTAPVLFGGRNPNDIAFSNPRFGLIGGKALSSSQAIRPTSTSPSNDVQLYIANHSIRVLPTELFWVGNLAVLSLRQSISP